MKFSIVFLCGSILSFLATYILANKIENGDTNAVSMYLLVFVLPCVIISLLNAIYLRRLNEITKRSSKVMLSLIPVVLFIAISITNSLTQVFFDGNFVFIATIEAIAIGLTNLIWIATLYFPH